MKKEEKKKDEIRFSDLTLKVEVTDLCTLCTLWALYLCMQTVSRDNCSIILYVDFEMTKQW